MPGVTDHSIFDPGSDTPLTQITNRHITLAAIMAPTISFLPAATIEILNGSNWLTWSSRILTLL
jgi:hypothetical protein